MRTIKIGDHKRLKFTVTDSDGDAINLTGGTLVFKIARNLNISDANATYYGEYTSFTSPALGIHIEVIPNSTTALFTPRLEKYQARFIDASGVVQSDIVDDVLLYQNLIDNV